MFTPIVRHWRRGDRDRLYVTTVTGRQLGWFDLADETLHTTTDGLRPMLRRAVTDFRLARRDDFPAAADLATHEAGVWELERAIGCVDESPLFFSASALCGERDERDEWQTAAESAAAIAQSVAATPGGWQALHGVPSGRRGERLDHVLVGPAGVVVVLSEQVAGGDVASAGDSVVFDGVPQKIVGHLGKLADHVATRAGDAVPVRVVVVVHGATVSGRRPLADTRVDVVAAAELPALIAGLPAALDATAQDALFDRLRRRATWSPRSRAAAVRPVDPRFSLRGLALLDGLPTLRAAVVPAARVPRPVRARPVSAPAVTASAVTVAAASVAAASAPAVAVQPATAEGVPEPTVVTVVTPRPAPVMPPAIGRQRRRSSTVRSAAA